MKAIILAATVVLSSTPAAYASVVTMGSSYAESCYRAAEARAITRGAREACDYALISGPLTKHDRVGTHVNRGVLWMISGDLIRANRDFDQALALDSSEPEAWLNKAIAQMNAGNSRDALGLVSKAIELRTSKPAIAYYVRGLANEDTGNLRAAYADLNRARELAPKWHEPAVELARYQVRFR